MNPKSILVLTSNETCFGKMSLNPIYFKQKWEYVYIQFKTVPND